MNLGVEIRKTLLFLAVACLVFSTLWCYAAERVVVSVVFPSDVEAYRQAWEGFQGFFDAKKVPLWVSEYTLKEEEPAAVYSRINKAKPDVVVTMGTRASKLAKEKIKNIPVVFCMVFHPEEITTSNITGVSMEIPVETKLQGIKRILPHTKTVGLIYSPGLTATYKEISRVCSQIGFKLIGKKVDSEGGFPNALKDIFRRIDCFLMVPDSKIYSPESVKHLLLQSFRGKFPVVGLSSLYTKAGALFSFDCDYNDLGRQAAKITLRILNGERPAYIECSIPRKTKVSLNRLAAERLGIDIPPQIMKEASEVFGE